MAELLFSATDLDRFHEFDYMSTRIVQKPCHPSQQRYNPEPKLLLFYTKENFDLFRNVHIRIKDGCELKFAELVSSFPNNSVSAIETVESSSKAIEAEVADRVVSISPNLTSLRGLVLKSKEDLLIYERIYDKEAIQTVVFDNVDFMGYVMTQGFVRAIFCLKELSFANCAHLNDFFKNFPPIKLNNLEKLRFRLQMEVDVALVLQFIKNAPHLKEIILKDCPDLDSLKDEIPPDQIIITQDS